MDDPELESDEATAEGVRKKSNSGDEERVGAVTAVGLQG